MSHLQESASYSSSPFKVALRSKQGPPRSLLPLPQFEEPHLRFLAEEKVIEASVVAEAPVTDLVPFFALVENSSTSEHHHPTVHYIFADDDAELISEAACRALAQDDPQHVVSQEEEENKLPASIDGVHEHYILLDVQPCEADSGYEVTGAHSLSSEWQVTKASISSAPTIDGTGADSGEGLMLKIEGISAMPKPQMDEATRGKKENLQQMVARFEKGLAQIRKMLDEDQS